MKPDSLVQFTVYHHITITKHICGDFSNDSEHIIPNYQKANANNLFCSYQNDESSQQAPHTKHSHCVSLLATLNVFCRKNFSYIIKGFSSTQIMMCFARTFIKIWFYFATRNNLLRGVIQTYLANLSFLATAEQIICRTPLTPSKVRHDIRKLNSFEENLS